MRIIQIDRNHLRAALHTSSVRDIRHYLNGVCVEVMKGQTRIISTDGTVLSVFRTMIENPEHAQFIIPNEIVKSVKKGDGIILIEIDEGKYTLVDGTTRVGFTPIDAKYPNYRQAFPSATYESMPSQYNPDLLMQFVKIAKLLGGSPQSLHVKHNGNHAALVRILNQINFAGVIMPIRDCESKLESAIWVNLM